MEKENSDELTDFLARLRADVDKLKEESINVNETARRASELIIEKLRQF